jgi:hypothetical protein
MSCKLCRFVSLVDDNNGFCRRYPPQIFMNPNGSVSSTFPSVNPQTFSCGEFADKDLRGGGKRAKQSPS